MRELIIAIITVAALLGGGTPVPRTFAGSVFASLVQRQVFDGRPAAGAYLYEHSDEIGNHYR